MKTVFNCILKWYQVKTFKSQIKMYSIKIYFTLFIKYINILPPILKKLSNI